MNIPIHGISHVTFSVSDLKKSVAFYQSIFDADLVLQTERTVYFMVGDLWLALNVQENIPRHEIRASYTHLAFSLKIADFEKMEQRLTQFGVLLEPGRKREEGEGKSLYFFDPDGHLLEFHTGDLRTRLQAYLNMGAAATLRK